MIRSSVLSRRMVSCTTRPYPSKSNISYSKAFSTIISSKHPDDAAAADEPLWKPFDNFPDSFESRWARRKAIKDLGAPPSIGLIATGTESARNKSVAIRQMGCSRRVFLLDTHLTGETMEGFAYRLNLLKNNPQLSSILIATDGTDDSDTILRMLHDRDDDNSLYQQQGATDDALPPAPGMTFHVAGGYDPMADNIPENGPATLQRLRDLALAIRGGDNGKIPIVMVPHGMLSDGGAAYLLSSYVLATYETQLQITNPRRGLTFDPTGLSYWLSRVGQEFQQPSQPYAAGVALIMALTGYTANAQDLVETGLATHYIESPRNVPILEECLADLPAWKNQAILKPPKQYDGPGQHMITPPGGKQRDFNSQFRNVQVAHLIMDVAEYSADGVELFDLPDGAKASSMYDGFLDPSLDSEHDEDSLPTEPEWRTSHLVNYAATFSELFAQSPSIVQVYGTMKEVANNAKGTQVLPEDQALAQLFCQGIEAASPLATVVTDQLLRRGNGPQETWEKCLERELIAQTRMMAGVAGADRDFQTWRENGGKAPQHWSYPDVASVPRDQVLEILG